MRLADQRELVRDFSGWMSTTHPANGTKCNCLQSPKNVIDACRFFQLFRTLIDHCNDPMEIIDPETLRFVYVNEKSCKDLGYSREELLSMSVSQVDESVDSSLAARVHDELRRVGVVLCEGVHRRKDGSTFPVEKALKFMTLDRNYVVAVSRDISDRKKAEAALRRSEAHYRLLFTKNIAGVAISDLEGNVLDCNEAWVHMLGYDSPDELRGRHTQEFYSDAADRQPIMDALGNGAASESGEVQLRRKDGTGIWVLFNCVVRASENGVPILQATVIDISERKRAEEETRRSEERFRVALKDSPITVFNQDSDLRYTWIYNPQLYWQHDIIGKTDEDVLGRKNANVLTVLKRKVLKTGTSSREDISLSHNGKAFAFDMTIEPLFDGQGKVIGITGACMDIARLREMTDRLQDARDKLAQEKQYLEREIQSEMGFEKIIGRSEKLRQVLQKARIVAPLSSTVLLLGETGTGKELIARSLHALSERRDKTFVKLNCAAVPTGLLESELFGHEKGAFTGAVNRKVGRMELADGGTLFLDEVGELPLELQPKLLRVLQDREFERLGGVQTLRVDVRIIAATNRDLRLDIAEKNFREDLFYRLNVFPVSLPPLRERREDIPILIEHFLHKHASRMGKRIETVPLDTMKVLQNWSWPGNIRELENMIERMVIMTRGPVLAPPPAELHEEPDWPTGSLTEMEREHIIRVLRETNGVLSGIDGAASRLGVKRTTLQSMLKRFNIRAHEFRRDEQSPCRI